MPHSLSHTPIPQIVKMSDTMTMMFEAEDLEQASPATVSRVGMIFCEIRNLDWQPLRDVWLRSLPVTFEEHHPLIVGLFDWLFPAALYFVQKQCVIPTPVTGQVRSLFLVGPLLFVCAFWYRIL